MSTSPNPLPNDSPSPGRVPTIHSTEHIELGVPAAGGDGRPPVLKHLSSPAYHSPLRHHHRTASNPRKVKETYNARTEYSNSEDDGTAQHRINQYIIKQEIGRGSFGAVHLATDQFGNEYAVKEFSKTRLRKRAQSNYLRRPSVRRRPGPLGVRGAMIRPSAGRLDSADALELIKEEIAIMKKLNHQNLVSLIEVLDDPEEDSLYMVLEMCKKGVVMRVGLDDRADPYEEEQCRCWFRDMMLGIEYLHAQGIIHRDIKPDNCLVTADDTLKIVDFGVSEMFEKDSEMSTAKSAGSPAFMPPELCIAKHGIVSGKAADIWSMGVTLYCLKFGRIPFEKTGMLDLYESIRNDSVDMDGECSEALHDLLLKLLNKDPQQRITMDELREHPWITKHGTDPLLSKEENTAVIIEPPTEEELNAAITGNMGHLLAVMRAVKRFKELLFRKRPDLLEGILGSASRIVQPPLSMRPSKLKSSHSLAAGDGRPVERVLTTEGVTGDIPIPDNLEDLEQLSQRNHKEGITAVDGKSTPESTASIDTAIPAASRKASPATPKAMSPLSSVTSVSPRGIGLKHTQSAPAELALAEDIVQRRDLTGKGHAHDPLEDQLFLDIGISADHNPSAEDNVHIVAESPSAIEMNVYEKAYEEEVRSIVEQRGRSATLYLTRRVEDSPTIRNMQHIFQDASSTAAGMKAVGLESGRIGMAKLMEKARSARDAASTAGAQASTMDSVVAGLRALKPSSRSSTPQPPPPSPPPASS
ncbi:kinase-like protein [Pseudovirgaria hyperparasitica]|uniref:Kinase-like protein n=1 Tax=Pseudovirgaria hyperparasitica TaxID=470096 RepID=A0A6A6W2D1_9PEZI|nr:kinase-like protein [Pseudovirgaria hyperparasitica]KAF2756174.1 kinase-like protein [Pseudovirgaria hyperparasitica]